MHCPVCAAVGSMGLLREYKRGETMHRRYFCRQCCSEVCYENQALVSVLAIDEEGEVRPKTRRFWPLGGLEPSVQAS